MFCKELDHVTQHIVDSLYINILKNKLIKPAGNTGIYRERKRKTKHINKKPRRHGKQVWNNEGQLAGSSKPRTRDPLVSTPRL